jgi:hypothetical protein
LLKKQSSDEKEVMQWQMHRKISYLRSRHHLFKAIVDQRINGEGFLFILKATMNLPMCAHPISRRSDKIMFPFDTSANRKAARDGKSFVITMKGRWKFITRIKNRPCGLIAMFRTP